MSPFTIQVARGLTKEPDTLSWGKMLERDAGHIKEDLDIMSLLSQRGTAAHLLQELLQEVSGRF